MVDKTMPGWTASFTDLREAGVTLQEWIEYHRILMIQGILDDE